MSITRNLMIGSFSARAILVILFFVPLLGNAQIRVRDQRTEYLAEPLAVDTDSPRFTWKMISEKEGLSVHSWELSLGSDSLALMNGRGDIWRSGQKQDPLPLVVYNGPALLPHSRYYWRVTVYDNTGKLHQSPVATFETGYLGRAKWMGHWISDGRGPEEKVAPLFRKAFRLHKPVRRARAFIAVAGLYEMMINGQRIGDHVLDPAYTRFDRRILYVAHDITASLSTGENVVAIQLGNGWYNHQSTAVWNFHEAPWRKRPAFCIDIRVEYLDGTWDYVRSDRSWKTAPGPVVFNSIYTGEHYDANREIPGWDKPGFADSAWANASLRAAPAPLVVAQQMPPIRSVRTHAPETFQQLSDTQWVVKFSKNMAGVTRIRVSGEKGTVLRMIHGERLDSTGRVDLSNLDVHYRPLDDSDPFQTDIYVLSGKTNEVFTPRFNYKGFQYLEIRSSRPLSLVAANIEALEWHTDLPELGNIQSSHALLNGIWRATNNSYLSNLFGYPTDCPQREKNGWTGDAHIAQETGLFNYDGITVYEKWLADHRDEQQPNGVLPSIIPTGGWGYDWGNGPDWTSTIAILPWNLFLFYGDGRALRDNYEAIKKYVDNIAANYPSGICSWGLGDWIPVKSQTPVPFTSTAYYFRDAQILSQAATLLGRTGDANYYDSLAHRIRHAFNQAYFDSTKTIYGSGLQTEMSVALHFGLVPDQFRQKVADRLAARVRSDGVKLDVGLLGSKSILNALSENGYPDLAFRLASRDSFPSWGWWIKNGATSLYENWPIDAKSDISMNHIMFGEVGAWMYKCLTGIRPDPAQPGFRHFFLKPHFAEGVDEWKGTFNSPLGLITSHWKKERKSTRYTIEIPLGAEATCQLPIPRGKKVWLDGKEISVNTDRALSLVLTEGKHWIEIR